MVPESALLFRDSYLLAETPECAGYEVEENRTGMCHEGEMPLCVPHSFPSLSLCSALIVVLSPSCGMSPHVQTVAMMPRRWYEISEGSPINTRFGSSAGTSSGPVASPFTIALRTSSVSLGLVEAPSDNAVRRWMMFSIDSYLHGIQQGTQVPFSSFANQTFVPQ